MQTGQSYTNMQTIHLELIESLSHTMRGYIRSKNHITELYNFNFYCGTVSSGGYSKKYSQSINPKHIYMDMNYGINHTYFDVPASLRDTRINLVYLGSILCSHRYVTHDLLKIWWKSRSCKQLI